MKHPLVLIILLAACSIAQGQNNLEVKIDKIKNDNGDILIGLYSNEQSFPRHVADGKIIKASMDGVTVEFTDLKPGLYAISVLHDENSNKDMDQNGIGIPKEGYGFSNNAKASFGPPSFQKAKIELQLGQKDTIISIDMKYFGKKNQ